MLQILCRRHLLLIFIIIWRKSCCGIPGVILQLLFVAIILWIIIIVFMNREESYINLIFVLTFLVLVIVSRSLAVLLLLCVGCRTWDYANRIPASSGSIISAPLLLWITSSLVLRFLFLTAETFFISERDLMVFHSSGYCSSNSYCFLYVISILSKHISSFCYSK